MRDLIALTIAMILLATAGAAQAAPCPANARTASLALWPGDSIKTGKTVTGTHPCGRQLTCIGGIPGSFSSRECHWE